jgi:serine phosphatase RsbU (regulator of sigma subunit)
VRSWTGSDGAAGLDVEAMMRAVQTISEAIEPDRLIANLMHVVAATGGASHGHLLTDRDGDGQWLAQARIDTAADPQVAVLNDTPLAPDDGGIAPVPLSVVRYVARTGEAAIAADATQDSRFAHDRYVRHHPTRSILCLPLVNRGRITGILYMENAATAGVFTESRGRMLSMLSTQMAIAMENARLYGRMQQEVAARTQELERQSRELERTNHAFEDSITYASFLQNALLPDDDTLAELGEHAVIWWPRDVVGGDIYVARRTATGVLAGVIDCTGHGVPGAFMSMAAYAAFDYALENVGGASPAAILAAMDAYLRRVLSRNAGTAATNDGLDIALVRLNRDRDGAVFAGAGVDLVLADPPAAHPEVGFGKEAGRGTTASLRRVRGVKTGLGYPQRRAAPEPADHPIAVGPDRCLYIASDGVLDQVGGAKRLPFGRKRLEATLARCAGSPMPDQRAAITRALRDWQGTETQRDDITVLALRPMPADDGPKPARASATDSAAAPTA